MLFYLLELISSGILYFSLHIGSTGSFPAPLSAADERKCLERLANGDEEAKKCLIEHNLRLVAHIIKKYYSSCDEQDDLISIGTIGLIKGINSFKNDKGTRLATYAARCIENEILMYLRSRKKFSHDISMSEPIDTDSEGNPLTLTEIICTDDTIADDLDAKIRNELLYKYISLLSDERSREIIMLRYGLLDGDEHTQREIAAKLKISRSYVSRIEKKALAELRKRFNEKTQ